MTPIKAGDDVTDLCERYLSQLENPPLDTNTHCRLMAFVLVWNDCLIDLSFVMFKQVSLHNQAF